MAQVAMEEWSQPLLDDDGSSRAVKARAAFEDRDVQASSQAHELRAGSHQEATNPEGKYVKPVIFGGLDGVSTMFAFLAGAIGAELSLISTVSLGCAQLFAGAFGMGAGEYLSSEAEREVARREQAREHWEVEVNPQGEVKEMIDIYMGKGLTREDASTVANTLCKYKDFWVEHMMVVEIGIMPPDGGPEESMIQGLIMFLSFLTLGALPLIAFVVSRLVNSHGEEDERTSLISMCIAAVGALFLLGVLKAKSADMSVMKGGLSMAAQGCLSAYGAYLIGNLLPRWLDIA